jgi:hypothetical protein
MRTGYKVSFGIRLIAENRRGLRVRIWVPKRDRKIRRNAGRHMGYKNKNQIPKIKM